MRATIRPGFSANVVQTAANKGVLLALVAMAQTFVVITAGIDLSVGMVFVLTNCLASWIVVGTPCDGGAWRRRRSAGGPRLRRDQRPHRHLSAACSRSSRRSPRARSSSASRSACGRLPAATFTAACRRADRPGCSASCRRASSRSPRVVLVIWIPYQPFGDRAGGLRGRLVGDRRPTCRAFRSTRAKFCAYVLSGLAASLGGLFLTFVTYSGEASAANGGTYTLYSIAAVVLGGVSLFGGSGSAIGAIFGALMFRTIGDLLFVFNLDPLWQPLFQGVVLLAAVCIGSARLFQVRNRLELFP